MIIEISFLFLSLIGIIYYKFRNLRPQNFPPGPKSLPILGNLNDLGTDQHLVLWEWSKKYGPIVGFNFGPELAICLHGTELIKEALSLPVMNTRKKREATKFVMGDHWGILQSSGEIWKEQRRFALRHLRNFGFGKSSMEDLIMSEVNELSAWLKTQNGEPIALKERFALAVVNSLWKIVTGERYDHDDIKLHQILKDLERSAKAVLGFGYSRNLLIFFYPKLAKMFPSWSGWKHLSELSKPRLDLFDRVIAQHEATLEEQAPRDFIDVYLTEIRHTTNPASSFHAKRSGTHSLKGVMADFFTAGTDTTSVTLSWLNLYLLHNPTVQEKLYDELSSVVGHGRVVTLSDRKSLPYTEAVIQETLRLSSIVGTSVPHTTPEDIQFHGFYIPKDTAILVNIYANHHDPETWGVDVEKFHPERFLNKDGTAVVRHEALIPFGFGKRICIAETLARDTLFLFTANMALNFKVCGIPGQPLPRLETLKGQLNLTPIPYFVVMIERK